MMLMLVRVTVVAVVMLVLVGMPIVAMMVRVLIGMTVGTVVMSVLVGMVRPGEGRRCAERQGCDGCQDGLPGIGNGHSAVTPVTLFSVYRPVIFS